MGGARWCIVCVTEHWIAQNIPLNKQQVISEKKNLAITLCRQEEAF